MFRQVIMLSILAMGLGSAQNQQLPLRLEGIGNQQSPSFSTNTPWVMTISSSDIAEVQLYDATTGNKLAPLLDAEEILLTGTFFLVISTPGSWQLSIAASQNFTTTPISVKLPLRRYGFGTQRYLRSAGSNLNSTACTAFQNLLEAQNAFIDAGGPENDPQNLDPDGDGYACDYDPRETYEAPVSCKAGEVWRNPRYRTSDASYLRGRCIAQ